jgi:hypothetical protein
MFREFLFYNHRWTNSEYMEIAMRSITPVIDVPGAPPIPGLTFRRFRGEADYPVMVSILDACNVADDYEYINTVETRGSTFRLDLYIPFGGVRALERRC